MSNEKLKDISLNKEMMVFDDEKKICGEHGDGKGKDEIINEEKVVIKNDLEKRNENRNVNVIDIVPVMFPYTE